MKENLQVLRLLLALLGIFLSSSLYAQEKLDVRPSKKSTKPAVNDDTVDIEYDEKPRDANEAGMYVAPIEQIFKNPAFASGLASGADALNRSLETLMDSLFYSLLDNEINYDVTDHVWFSTRLQRDLYSTPNGSYVVVDRVDLGPKFNKELWNVDKVPVMLGADGSVDFMQIYLRSDGMRLAEQESLPTWRRWANNWFGILPLMTKVLPPSFNQNELYDPVKELETPFVFPYSLDGFEKMAIGSINSYAVSGGVNLGIDMAGFLDTAARERLEKLENVTGRVPYSIFARGEHRINVLRRDSHTAWVGLSKSKRVGHSVSMSLGDKLFVLRGALAAQAHGSMRGKPFAWDWVWKGVPIAMFPLDISFEHALAKLFDQVYEYDLRNPAAQEAYLRAVKGDFAPSHERYLDAKEQGKETGVIFHFTKTQDRVENEIRNGPNVGVYRNVRQNNRSSAEIEITDQDGRFYVLEGKQDTSDKVSDILVGEKEKRYQGIIELNVRKVMPKDDEDKAKFSYAFSAEEEPQRLTMTMSIQDGYVTTEEYRDYIADLRFFTLQPLDAVPDIEIQDSERIVERRREDFFVSPDNDVVKLHVMPTYLGRFGAQVGISLSSDVIDRVLETPEDDKWRAFAKTFGIDPEVWGVRARREGLANQSRWFGAFVAYPLRLINIRFSYMDAVKEAANAIAAMEKIAQVKEPLEKLEAFYQLFDSDHPAYLTHAILLLADLEKVPRSITFSAQPKGSARHETKRDFGKLNGKTFREGPPFPTPSRYAKANQKMAAFYLDQPRSVGQRPAINKIQVSTREIPSSIRDLSPVSDEEGATLEEDKDSEGSAFDRHAKQIFVTLQALNIARGSGVETPAKIYVRVDQGGKVKFGKLQLAEKVLDVMPLSMDAGIKMQSQIFEFYLTGPLSPLSNFMLNRSVANGDEFVVTLAISPDGVAWSDERQLEFKFVGGKLLPIR